MARFSASERHVLALTGVAHAATHFAELVYPTLAVVLARDTGIPLEHVLGWSFAGYLLFGLGALPAGYLADRLGERRLVLGGLVGMGLAAGAAGASRPGAPLAAALAVLGLAASVYHPAGMALISRAVRARGRALGVNGIFGSLGIAGTPVVTAVVAQRFGWQATFLGSGVVLLAFAAVLARLPIAARSAPAAAARAPAIRTTTAAAAALNLAAVFSGIVYRAGTIAQPAYFAERVAVVGFGAATTLAYLMGVLGQWVGGLVADHRDLRWSYFAFHLATVPALLVMSRTHGATLLVAAAVFTFAGLGMQPIENSLFAHFTPARWRSTGFGVKFVLSSGVGSLGVWLVRAVREAWGMAAVFQVLAVVVGLLLATILVLVALTGEREREPAGALGEAPFA
ncbi:MAG TPA: MFS transporter [Candidatus Binatia bacterium]|nr:MFS transporter [Candidatus Binatia bacterium]